MGARPLVLLTRPADRAAGLAAELNAVGIDTLIWPVLDIRATLATTPSRDDAQAVLLTSPRAVEMLPDPIGELTGIPAFCVGGTTASAAQRAGLTRIHDADGDAADLAALVATHLSPDAGPLLYLRGRDVARDMGALLPRFEVRPVEVYRAEPMIEPDADVLAAICAGNLTAVAFFSPRAATIFDQALTKHMIAGLAQSTAIAMSERVANKVNQTTFQRIEIAANPTAAAMHAAICGACGIALPQNGV